MISFQYSRANNVAEAVRVMADSPGAKFIAGGTNLVDLMKMDVERPTKLIDVSKLPLDKVEETTGGWLRIGALVRNSDLAYHPLVEQRYPVLSSALLAGASQQLRNMASIGGNLLQRTRCPYFYDVATPCNKREAGSGCSALDGLNRMNAILGTSDNCIAVHPSDMCVALAALEAKVHVIGTQGERVIAFADFHRLPEDEPQRGRSRERPRSALVRPGFRLDLVVPGPRAQGVPQPVPRDAELLEQLGRPALRLERERGQQVERLNQARAAPTCHAIRTLQGPLRSRRERFEQVC